MEMKAEGGARRGGRARSDAHLNEVFASLGRSPVGHAGTWRQSEADTPKTYGVKLQVGLSPPSFRW